MMIKVYRHPEGISLNGREYLLDHNNKEIEFETMELVHAYLKVDTLKNTGVYTEGVHETEDNYPIVEQLRIDLKVFNSSQIKDLYDVICEYSARIGMKVLDDGNAPYTEDLTESYIENGFEF